MADMFITQAMKRGDMMHLEYTDGLWVKVIHLDIDDAFSFSNSEGYFLNNMTSENVFDLLVYYPMVYEIKHYKKDSCKYFYKSNFRSYTWF